MSMKNEVQIKFGECFVPLGLEYFASSFVWVSNFVCPIKWRIEMQGVWDCGTE